MNKRKYAALFLLALVLIPAVVGCVPRREGVSWANMTVIGSDNYILVSYNDFMILVDPATRQLVPLVDSEGGDREDNWELKNDGSKFFTTPVQIDEEIFLIADYNDRLAYINFTEACLSRRNGACINDMTSSIELPGHVMTDMTVHNGVAYVPLMEHGVVAVDIEEETILWEFDTERGVWTSPLLDGDRIYVGSMDHKLHAISVESGELIWDLNVDGAIASTPILYDGRLYLGTFGRELLEISTDGEILTRVDMQNWVWSSPVIYENVLYVTDLSGYVYAFEPNGLEEIWRKNTKSDGIRPSPIVTDEYVIVASRDGKIYWLQRDSGATVIDEVVEDGETKNVERVVDVDAEILSELVLLERSEETVIIVSTTKGDKILEAYQLDGTHRWKYPN